MRALLLVVATCLLVGASMTVVGGLPPECGKLARMAIGGFELTPAEWKFFTDNCDERTEAERKRDDEKIARTKFFICTWSTSPSCVRCKDPLPLFEGDDPKAMCPGTYEIFPNPQAAGEWHRANCCK
jgi:hypothetical protein